MPPTYNRFFRDATGELSATSLQRSAIVNVLVHVPVSLARLLSAEGREVPLPSSGMALIDTGASTTCVHEPSMLALNVNPIRETTMRTAAGPVQQNLYPVRLEFPGEALDLDFSTVAGVDLSGQMVTVAGQSVQIVALVGRDVLADCVLIYNGSGGFFSLST